MTDDDVIDVDMAVRELERLATAWFVVKLNLLGTTISVDLRLLAPVFPFALATTLTYLYVIRRKSRSLLAQLDPAPETRGGSAQYELSASMLLRHPQVLLNAILLGLGCIVGYWTYIQYADLADLLSDNAQTDYLNTLLWVGGCLSMYACYVHTAIRPPQDSVQHYWAERLIARGAAIWRTAATAAISWRPTRQLFGGAAIVLVTLFTGTAISCGSERAASGYEYLKKGYNPFDIRWFSGPHTSLVMWILYWGTIVFSALFLIVPSTAPTGRIARKREQTAVVIYTLTVLTAVCSICFYTVSTGDEGNLAALVAAIGIYTWSRRHISAAVDEQDLVRSRQWAGILFFLTISILTFGRRAVEYIYAQRLIGIPLLLSGCLIQLRILRSRAQPNNK